MNADKNVDVLSVLDKNIAGDEAFGVDPEYLAELREARAAVAELIEAAKKAQAMMAMPERIEARHRQELCDAIGRCEVPRDPRIPRPVPPHAAEAAAEALESLGYPSAANRAREMGARLAAAAELIEADKEYDKARAAVSALRDGVSTVGEVVYAEGALRRAQERRAAALAAHDAEAGR